MWNAEKSKTANNRGLQTLLNYKSDKLWNSKIINDYKLKKQSIIKLN